MEKSIIEKTTENVFIKTLLLLLAASAALITIYTNFQEDSINLQYEILTNANVLDINAEVSNLEILYDSTSLNQTNENLRIVTLRVINNGKEPILKTYFDDDSPMGLSVENGRIIEKPELINTSNDYISNNLEINYDSPNNLYFSSLILDSEEFFTVKLLILHNRNEEISIIAKGKIAGQRSISISNSSQSRESLNPLSESLTGNWKVQLIRSIVYFFPFVIIILSILFLSNKISDFKRIKTRKKRIFEFKELNDYQFNRVDEVIFERYKNNGTYELEKMLSLTEDETDLNEYFNKIEKEFYQNNESELLPIVQKDPLSNFHKYDLEHIYSMIQDGLVIKQDDTLIVNKSMRKTLQKFSDYLKSVNGWKTDRYNFNVVVRDDNEDQ